MVAAAVKQTIAEAKKKPKILPQHSEESVAANRSRATKGLPGYAHSDVLDLSKPLGKKNLAKRQGATGMGNWTSESHQRKVEAIKALVRLIVAEEISVNKGR